MMEARIRGCATENAPEDEEKAIRLLITLLKRRLDREYAAPKRVLRDAHPKQHGLVRAHFIVDKNLPELLRVGIFKDAKTFKAWIRFSNMSDPPQSDAKKDSRGMAIKLLDVEGDQIDERFQHNRTQDFVLMSSDFFVTRGVADFARLVAALEAGMWRLVLHFITHPRLLWLFLRIRQYCASPLEISYGSTTPYLLGENAVKYAARPVIQEKTPMPLSPAPDFLREVMEKHLATRSANFDFFVQLQADPVKMPIEDARVVWDEKVSPWIRVARIEIPIQQFNSPRQNEYGDQLSFNPWHCLREHRPLGGINRARRVIYDEMSTYRHNRNTEYQQEPSDWIEF